MYDRISNIDEILTREVEKIKKDYEDLLEGVFYCMNYLKDLWESSDFTKHVPREDINEIFNFLDILCKEIQGIFESCDVL